MIIDHYSDEDLRVIHPASGPDFPGNGAERKRAQDPGYLPRWYGYVHRTRPEARIRGRRYRYEVFVRKPIYDLDEDSEGLRNLTDTCFGQDLTALEREIYQRAYDGYRSGNVVAVFLPAIPSDKTQLRCTRCAEECVVYLKERDTSEQVGFCRDHAILELQSGERFTD